MDKARIAMNEAAFRRVNDAIEAGQPDAATSLDLICECGRLGCNDHVTIPADTYQAIRANPRRFVIIPGHELPEAERIVDTHGNYLIVEKFGEAGEVAEEQARPPLPDVGL